MGSIESTPTPSTTRTATMDEDSGSNNNALMEENRNGNQNRRVRRYSDSSLSDDPWWWEIENENIAFDQVMPSVSMTTATTASNDESEIELSEDFNSLLKIGETVNLTLSDTSGNNNISNDNKRTARITNGLPAATLKEMHSENTNAQKTEYPVNNSINASTINDELLSSAAVTVNNEREQSLEEFKEELRIKRLARQTAVQDLRHEITTLRKQLTTEQALTRRLRSPAGDTDDDCVDGSGEATTTRSAANISITKDIMVDTNAAVAAAREYSCMDADDEDPQSRSRHANIELANAQLALQLANADNLSLRTELGVVQKQVGTLKEVISCCKQMLAVKEEQCTQLKSKLQEIETSFGEQEMKIMSANLRQEYERQLGNIRQLRQLYEERQRISAAEHENLQRLISIKKDELLAEQEKSKNFEERNQTLMKEVENANTQLAIMREECNEHKFEKKAVKEEMAVVNTLFSQMVLGFNGKNNLDIDRLTTMLEENRTLLNDMATKEINCSDGATLPKLLFELVEQAAVGNGASSRSPSQTFEVEVDQSVDADAAKDPTESMTAKVQYDMQIEEEKEVEDAQRDIGATAIDYESADKEETTAAVSSLKSASTKKYHRKNASCKANTSSSATSSSSMQATATLKLHEPEVIGKVATAQEIIGNLPKVWKVLSHLLLSHHKIEQVQFEENGAGEDCYKSVETPNGPKAELSVSKTYIKLKDLILEKKALVKETNRLKTLNCHLDYRLNEQEKRLSAVSLELTKTWHLVGKMQRQHRQLHTQEQILRYQLQQKRRLLTELKDELEYCRRKWAAARAKNDESQEQCDDLRREFAKRKLEDANNSAESGYSDSGPASDEEERAGVVVAASSVGGGFSSGDGNEGGCVGAVGIGGGSNVAACRRKYLKEMFEHKRKIKRMQSTSPGRAGDGGFCSAVGAGDGGGVGDFESVDIVLRWNSAPPTCGWRTADNDAERPPLLETASGGAIPKRGAHSSRSAQRKRRDLFAEKEEVVVDATEKDVDVEPRTERAFRIQRLEEQCKSLIQQVLETSDNRERLEVQLCRFQDEIAPVQYAVPLDEFINRKRIERTKRASSVPATGTLTPREEEYTRKRSERLERLEEESRQLMSHIKRTSDRGHYLRCSLDRIRRGPSREGSFESNTEVDNSKTDETASTTTTITDNDILDTTTAEQEEFVNTIATTTTTITTTTTLNDKSPLTAEEEEYTARRTARLQRLEEDGKQLLASLLRNTERGSTLGNKLDDLHGRYDSSSECMEFSPQVSQDLKPATIEQRIENIEKISTNREERLRILEEEGKQLISRLSNTSERGTQMMNRIAERELNRQARSIATPSKDDENEESVSSSEITKTIDGQNGSNDPNPEATELMPTLKNVACSSIVYEELTDCVTVTTTASQIAAAQQQGAIPKLKPKAQLSAARHKKSRNLANKESKTNENADAETLEEMVKRLKELPFPNREGQDDEDKVKEKQPDQEDQE